MSMRAVQIVFLAAALMPQSGVAQVDDVKTHMLDNGLKVLVQEDHNIPNVAMYFFYRIGSRNERPGITGISHFFEHMMFNGAKKYGPKQFDNTMEKAGGNNNAYTSRDVTVYTDWFPATALELMFDMESDRMRDLAFDPKMIDSERGVVYSERRTSVDNSNFGTLYEQLEAAAFIAHPYHWPVLGWPSDIEAWSMDDLKAHFKTGYAPNNCTLVVVGDTTDAQVMLLARKYLESIPRQDPPAAVRTKEPEQKGERRVLVRKQAQLPLQMFAYHIPDAKSPENAALQVFDTIMTQGQSCRLYKRMVDSEQLAINVNGNQQQSLDPGLFVFTVQPRSGVDPARTETALFEEIAKAQAAPVSAEELRKAKNQLLAANFRQRKTIAGRANLLGTFEVFQGDYRKLFTLEQEIENVTADQVQSVAKKYFMADNRTVGTLLPLEAK